MNREDCDIYEPKVKGHNYICKHYTGNEDSALEKSMCRHYCSYYESMELMQGNDRIPLVRKNGRLRRK